MIDLDLKQCVGILNDSDGPRTFGHCLFEFGK